MYMKVSFPIVPRFRVTLQDTSSPGACSISGLIPRNWLSGLHPTVYAKNPRKAIIKTGKHWKAETTAESWCPDVHGKTAGSQWAPEAGKCEPCEVEPVIGGLPVGAGRVVPVVEQA